VSDLRIERRRGGGLDRLYVSQLGTPVGWFDLHTGASMLADERLRSVFHDALMGWRSGRRAAQDVRVVDTPARSVSLTTYRPPRNRSRGSLSTMSVVSVTPTNATIGSPVTGVPVTAAETPRSRGERLGRAMNGAVDQMRTQTTNLRKTGPVGEGVRDGMSGAIGRVRESAGPHRWRLRPDREQKVASRLHRLPTAWKVLKSIALRRNRSVDHLVVGPGGVFAVFDKYHPRADFRVVGDTVRVNGKDLPYLDELREDADTVSRRLSRACGFHVEVTGVLAVVGTEEVGLSPHPEDVGVVTAKKLTKWLANHPPVLERDLVEVVTDVAEQRETWERAS
jgi:Nuclease-related domain